MLPFSLPQNALCFLFGGWGHATNDHLAESINGRKLMILRMQGRGDALVDAHAYPYRPLIIRIIWRNLQILIGFVKLHELSYCMLNLRHWLDLKGRGRKTPWRQEIAEAVMNAAICLRRDNMFALVFGHRTDGRHGIKIYGTTAMFGFMAWWMIVSSEMFGWERRCIDSSTMTGWNESAMGRQIISFLNKRPARRVWLIHIPLPPTTRIQRVGRSRSRFHTLL